MARGDGVGGCEFLVGEPTRGRHRREARMTERSRIGRFRLNCGNWGECQKCNNKNRLYLNCLAGLDTFGGDDSLYTLTLSEINFSVVGSSICARR